MPSTPETLPPEASQPPPYTLASILGIWAAATVPMGLLAWGVWPAVRTVLPLHPGLSFWMLMIVGMVWQFVLSLTLLRQELGTLRWSVVAARIWARPPRSPHGGAARRGLWWRLLPIALGFGALSWLSGAFVEPWLASLGWVAPAGTQISELVDPRFAGQWWILGLALLSFAFNYLLGEELLFRGVLLPRMGGVFGRADWLANAVLFALYHVHLYWAMPAVLLTSLPFSWAARRYRTIWFAAVLHGIEGVVLLVLVTLVLSGVASG